MNEIRVILQFNRGEYVRGMRYYMRKSGVAGPRSMALFLLITACTCGLFWLTGTNLLNTAVLVLLVLWAARVGGLYFIAPGRGFDKDEKLRQRTSYTFTKADIGMQNESTAGVFPWTFTAFWSTGEFYYLIQSQSSFTMLPKHIFSDDRARADFEEMVKVALPDVRYKVYR